MDGARYIKTMNHPRFCALSKPMNIYIGEDLKPHPVGVLCFKSLPIPLL